MTQISWPKWPQCQLKDKALSYLSQILDSDRWTVRGDKSGTYLTELFEESWAELCATKYAIAVNSGSQALELMLKGIGIGPGDEVIVSSLGWYATQAAVVRVGATPIFADVDLKTTCICTKEVKKKITPSTKAILVTHLHCATPDLKGLILEARKHSIPLLEDASQAHGATYNGKPIGSLSTAACFSFNQEKLIASGEGGVVVTNDKALFLKMYALRTDGYLPPNENRNWYFNGNIRGQNLCISEFQAAVLLAQLEAFDSQASCRNKHADMLNSLMESIDGFEPILTVAENTSRAFYEYGFFVSKQFLDFISLDEIAKELTDYTKVDIHRTDEPVTQNPLFCSNQPTPSLPNAVAIYESLLVFHHRFLLDERIVLMLINGLQKLSSRFLAKN